MSVSLEDAAEAAYHLCESLLAVREGPTDALIVEVRDALHSALEETRLREARKEEAR
jgi:hypothetical protein